MNIEPTIAQKDSPYEATDLNKRPRDREELRRWLTLHTRLFLPTQANCACHQTPLDYLAHVFFENPDEPGDAAVWACRGGGKTMIGAVATLLDLWFKPGIQVRILGGSLEQSQKMYAYLRGFFERKFAGALRRAPTRRRLELKNGSVVEILAQSDRSVRGTRVQKLRCDEVELFDPGVWQAAQLTTRAAELIEGEALVRGSVEALSTMHVPGGLMQNLLRESGGKSPAGGECGAAARRKVFAWCLWDVIARCHPRRKCERCPLWNDCRGRAKTANGFLRISDAIAMHARVSRATWEHEMLCYPPVLENAVFGTFRRGTHVRDWPLTDRQAQTGERVLLGERIFSAEKLIAGVDFGYIGAFVCLWIEMLRDHAGRRVVWVVDELVTRQRTVGANAAAMWEKSALRDKAESNATVTKRPAGTAWQPAIVYCDVAGRGTNSHTGRTDEGIVRSAGFKVQSRPMGIEDGIALINELVDPAAGHDGAGNEAPRLLIDPRCSHLIAAMESYHRTGKGDIDKDGTHDHPIDALRYALANHDRISTKTEVRNY